MDILFMIIFPFMNLLLSVNGGEPVKTNEIIRHYGYPLEEHKTFSVDGFVITTFRIPSSPYAGAYDIRVPVLFCPPLLGSSALYVDNTRTGSLADQGYDVWLTNTRGSQYSKENRFYTEKDSEYWDYSYQESAIFDIPVLIDYILQVTGHEKLFYIGFSMGTTIGFFMLSALPQYNEKLHAFIAMAPVVSIANAYNSFQYSVLKMAMSFSTNVWPFNKLLKGLNLKPFAPVFKPFCRQVLLWRPCLKMLSGNTGDTASQINGSRFTYYLNHFPDITSLRTLDHYLQSKDGRFKMYDFGTEKNLIKYQQATAPDLDLGKVTAPVAFYSALSDKLSTAKDIEVLSKKLPNLQYYQPITIPGFGHGSFIWGLNAPQLVYNKILDFMATKVKEFYFSSTGK